MAYKTQNQIYKDFKTFINTALLAKMKGYLIINDWEIKKLNQTIKTEDLKPCVYMQMLPKKQVGTQYRTNNKIIENGNESYIKTCYCKKLIKIRFSATRRFLLSDTVETYNAIDVLDKIKSYFQSPNGIQMFATQDYAQYRATDIQEQSFTNDDENIQLMPYFDCEYLYTDSFEQQINKLDKVEEIYKKGV